MLRRPRPAYSGGVLRALVTVLALGLTVFALIDCIRTDKHRVQALPKIVWVLVIVLVPVVGPVAWLLAGRSRATPGRVARPGPVAPDDDPEFLRQLEWQRQQEAEDERLRRLEEELRREDDGDGSSGPDRPDDAGRSS